MGWLVDDELIDEHEGYLVGVVKDDWQWRELGVEDAVNPRFDGPISWMQIACSCGWRSQRLVAPLGTEWFPCTVMMRSDAEHDAFRSVWESEHRSQLNRIPDLAHEALWQVRYLGRPAAEVV